MAKYSFEFKKEVVLEYFAVKEEYKNLAHKYGITGASNIRKWVSYYQKLGDEDLLQSRQTEEIAIRCRSKMRERSSSSTVSEENSD